MHPFIEILGLKIPSYGLMMAIALITALLISYFRAKKAKLDLDIFSNMAIIAIICGLAGAYLLYIFVTYPLSEIWESIKNGSFSTFKNGGLVFYGAIIAGFLAAFIYLKIKKQRFLDYAACIVPSVPLAHAIGRVGCFLAGCCYGRCIDTPISVIYKNPIGGAPVGVPVFPIQLVESCCNIIIFIILLLYTRKNIKRRSVLFLYMLLYGIERFFLEYGRYDEIRGIFLGLSTSQWISIAMVVGGIIGFILLHRHEKLHPELYEEKLPAEGEEGYIYPDQEYADYEPDADGGITESVEDAAEETAEAVEETAEAVEEAAEEAVREAEDAVEEAVEAVSEEVPLKTEPEN